MSNPLYKNVCSEQLFASLFRKHAANLHSFLLFKYGNRLLPKDKVQEAFIKLWQHCEKVTPDKAKGYLYTVASNLMLNELDHQKVVLKFRQKKIPKTATSESPEFLLQEKEYSEKLQTAINNLTEAERVAFLLNRTEGKKHREIAEILGIGQKAVEKRIYGAVRKLKKEIEEFK